MLIFGGYGASHEQWSYDDVTFEDLEVGSFGIFLLYLMGTRGRSTSDWALPIYPYDVRRSDHLF